MKTFTIVKLSYKATHYVSELNDKVHSNEHFHTWIMEVELKHVFDTLIDAHYLQKLAFEHAPHFKSHGDKTVEQVAEEWFSWWRKPTAGVDEYVVNRVKVTRDDGLGAVVYGTSEEDK